MHGPPPRATASAGDDMDTLLQDVRYAIRGLRASPGFALLTVVTLALGIGANAAIFSVVNGVVLRPLSYPTPERLVFVSSQFPGLGFDKFWVSAPEFIEFREMNNAFESVGAFTVSAANLGTERPSRPVTAFVTHDLLEALATPPILGRRFTAEDTRPGAERVGILSHGLWVQTFASDPGVLDRVVDTNGLPTRLIGVMPPGFDVHDRGVELWLPLTIDPAAPGNRGGHFLHLIGRLKPDVTLAQARADLEALLTRWSTVIPESHTPNTTTHRLRLDPLHEEIVGDVRLALWILQGAVGFVLLIACANLANLLLARAGSRQKEFAIRAALGAGRGRMLRQFLTEGVLLSLMGGGLGILMAFGGLRALLAANPDGIPRAAAVEMDAAVLVFTLLVAVGTGLLFGLAPLLQLSRGTMGITLKEAGARTTAGSARARARSALVMAEVALAVVLVVGAGLLLRSFWNLRQVDPGFDRSRLMTFGLVLPAATYPEPERRAAFFRDLLDRLAQAPGVQGTAAMTGLPPQRQVNANDTSFEGLTPSPDGPPHNVDYYQTVTADYVATMGIPVRDGRGFSPADATGAPVVMINETLARTFYPDEGPIGRRIRPCCGDEIPWFTVIGVVRDVKQGGLEARTGTELYFLAEQGPSVQGFAPGNMNIVIRSPLPLESLAPMVREAVHSMDPALPIVRMRTMEEVFATAVSRPRFLAQLLGIFAGLALLLAAVGTYGILSYSVTERRHEIGIRMALGASRRRVLGMVVGHGAALAGAGLVVGLGAALILSRLLGSLLFDVRPADPATLAAVSGCIVAVALAACLIPARRATLVDPMVVLRED
jgi:putative ABC transport system permease protein